MRRCQIWHHLNHRRGVNLSLRSRRILRHLNNVYMQRAKIIDTHAGQDGNAALFRFPVYSRFRSAIEP